MKAPKKGIKWETLGFGFSDVNCHIRYTWKNGKWSKPKYVKEPFIQMHIGASCLHYGQECFEGIKAFRQKSGKIVIFRPDENAKRMFRTAQRTCMPAVPVEMFVDACKKVVKKNNLVQRNKKRWLFKQRNIYQIIYFLSNILRVS